MRLPVSLLSLALVGALALPAAAQDFSVQQKGAIEGIVRDYLVQHPEVVKDALVELQKREKADEASQRQKIIDSNAAALFDSKHQAVIGNPKGGVTIVEFFDYNCGYCKRSLGDVGKLVKENPNLRVILKDFPVLGPDSMEAAQVAEALQKQFTGDKYWEFHQKLLSQRGRVGKTQALAAARELGADMARLDKDMTAPDARDGIVENMKVADQLSINGTPTWIMGKDVVVGAVGHDELREKIANVGKCGRTEC
ncbi:MAG: thioredoxin domain-containing protein [Hyphomicrobiales bacterium]|nr:thioredoxin domain-containing protein [Hyphomicrobiales bacterium]